MPTRTTGKCGWALTSSTIRSPSSTAESARSQQTITASPIVFTSSAPYSGRLAHTREELGREIRRFLVAVRLGQRSKAGEIGEQEGVVPVLAHRVSDDSRELRNLAK
jgi:hypothetical protein